MPRRVPILMYHRLGEVRRDSIVPGHYVAPTLFERQLRLLQAIGMESVSLKRMREGLKGETTLPKRPVVLTFDDGYESFWSLGMPRLRQRGMSATVFLVSDLIGKKNEWDLAKGDVEERLMSREQVLAAAAEGVEFGAHTRRHADLAAISLGEAEKEIVGSKADLESWIGRSVDFFCYPYGAQTPEVRALVAHAGYLGATGTRLHGNGPDADPYLWGRINVRYDHTPFRLMRRLLKAWTR